MRKVILSLVVSAVAAFGGDSYYVYYKSTTYNSDAYVVKWADTSNRSGWYVANAS